jgi:glucose-6-phosphate isomerase
MWDRYKEYLCHHEELGLTLDISRVPFTEDYLSAMEEKMAAVYRQMEELEGGAIANPDEGRMVGHYWLRNPELAPEPAIAQSIKDTVETIKAFAARIHAGEIIGEKGRPFINYLVIGIGGSSLGPKFVADALGSREDKLKGYFIDNTDPDGMDRVFARLEGELDQTLTIVISKSGGTVETRNGMEEARHFYAKKGLSLPNHGVVITQSGSKLDQLGKRENWLAAFPMWDWVGGRTSVLSAVGLLPLALQGIDIDELLAGARECDQVSRQKNTRDNPAALMTLMWYWLTKGQGGQQLVMLPYKDRLELFTKYLQQLIMESLGKEKDLSGNIVHQGIAVLGNKGSTDQHSYVQQLLEGPDNFFVTFVRILKDREGLSPIIAENSTSGDYLQAFLLGTRKALTMKGRASITITLEELNSFTVGVLLSLFERTVSMYALLVNINAYHQPAVELGKKSAGEIIALKNQVVAHLRQYPGRSFSVEELAKELEQEQETETIFQLLQHLIVNPQWGIKSEGAKSPLLTRYRA